MEDTKNYAAKRDQFAMAALTGLIASNRGGNFKAILELARQRGVTSGEIIAAMAYEYADAMMEARK